MKIERKWYRKKRTYGALLLFLWGILGQTEFARMRYNPDQLADSIHSHTGLPVWFDTRQVEEKEIHFIQVGKTPLLPTVVLVHGSPGALNAYEAYLSDSLLSHRANLIAVDRPGFGYSDFGQTEPSLAIQANMIAAILKDIPVGPKILVGHSLGGPIISKLAMDFPELADGLVLVAPSISPDLEPSNSWRKCLNIAPVCCLTPSALRVCNQEIIPLKTELEAMRKDWKNLDIPVTVIQGKEDALVPIGNSDFAKAVLSGSPDVKLHKIEGGDHFILWSEVPLIIREILDLLEKI